MTKEHYIFECIIRAGKLAGPQLPCFISPDFKSLLEDTLAELLPIAIDFSLGIYRVKREKQKKADRKGEKKVTLLLG